MTGVQTCALPIYGKALIKGSKISGIGEGIYYKNYIKSYFNREKNKFIITSDKLKIRTMMIFNVLGNLIDSIDFGEGNQNVEIDAGKYINGIYLSRIKFLNNEINNIVLIKN